MIGFQKFLDHALFPPIGDAQNFGEMKGVMEIHNHGKFTGYTICGYQVIYLQSFSYQQNVGFSASFGWFLVDYNPKSSPICTKFSPVMECIAKHHIFYSF